MPLTIPTVQPVSSPTLPHVPAIKQPRVSSFVNHLDCVALERAPAKWVCEACDVSGTAANTHEDDVILPYLEMCLIT